MALHLQFSNSLKALAKSFLQQVKRENTSVFQPNYIITQTEGMNNWLKMQMTEEWGIAANYQFLKPNDFIYQVFFLLSGKITATLHPENQKWLLFKLLNEPDFKHRFKDVAQYYHPDFENADIKRLSIAQNVADLFDQYQIYRKELIEGWNKSGLDNLSADDWQKYLWIKAQTSFKEKLPDKTIISAYIEDAIKNPFNQKKITDYFKQVHLFGLSVITQYHLDLFYLLGQHIEIYFHLLNPAPEQYWFEDKNEKYLAFLRNKQKNVNHLQEGNSLLLNWGKVTQDTFLMLFNQEYLLNHYTEIPVEESKPISLLQTIQADIYHNKITEERDFIDVSTLNDGSIMMSACHTPLREVEVLYNYLVSLVSKKNGHYSARDVVVMVSDINAYSPYIKAVFNKAPYKFSYTIADESFENEESLINALKHILQITKENFTAENVLQLLEFNTISQRFGIRDINSLREIVGKANIRNGIEGSRDDGSVFISWKNGINRIILGICMGGEGAYEHDELLLFPLDGIEGAASFNIIRFCHFVNVLIDSIHEREKQQSPSEWAKYIENVIQNFLNISAHEIDPSYEILNQQLTEYKTLHEFFDEEISYDVFSFSYLQTLKNTTKANKYASGGITFCSLIPMRSIPFKVVALLGLDSDKFPRKETKSEFNLMKEIKRGDRDVKNNDKHLFLETLLSAEEHLYISYIGQNPNDNTPKSPSLLVDELIDYIALKTLDENKKLSKKYAQEALVQKQPLHSFSRKYQHDDLKIPNFLNVNQLKFEFKESNQVVDDKEVIAIISIDFLIKFVQNPIKFYYNQILQIRYESNSFLIPEMELFELDHLQKWGLRNDLLHLNESELPDYIKHETAKGNLPLKNMANIALNPLIKEINKVKELAGDLILATRNKVFVDELLHDSSVRINGEIADFYGDNLIQICFSKNEIKYILKLYIQYLVAISAGIKTKAYFISNTQEKIFNGKELDHEVALNQLKLFIKWYKKGNLSLVPSLIEKILNTKKIESITNDEFIKLIHKHMNDKNSFPDEYLLSEYKNGFFELDSTFENFKSMATELLVPIYEFLPEFKF